MTDYNKRLPADITLESQTFLNDKKIDGDLYAYLLHRSIVKEVDGVKRTYCPYEPGLKTNIGKVFDITQHTVRSKLEYLEQKGYIERETPNNNSGYYLNVNERYFFDLPFETLHYLSSVFNERVIKTYIYLGIKQKWCIQKFGKPYNFTKAELIQHCGFKEKRNHLVYAEIEYILATLEKLELIKTREFYYDGLGIKGKKIELQFWTTKVPKRQQQNQRVLESTTIDGKKYCTKKEPSKGMKKLLEQKEAKIQETIQKNLKEMETEYLATISSQTEEEFYQEWYPA